MKISAPPLFSGDLFSAISALARAAHSYRSVLFIAADANRGVVDTLLKHEDLLNLSDSVINAWRTHLGHDIEDDNDRLE